MASAFRNPRVAALLFLAACAWLGHTGVGRPAGSPVARDTAIVPGRLGPWVGHALSVDQRAVVDVLETDDVALMEYRLGAEPPVWLAQVAEFGNRAAFHPPELCYVGSHFEVLERGPLTVMVKGEARHVMRLVLGQNDRQYEAWYWFTAGERMTPSYYRQQLWLVADAINRKPMSGTLVRISTPRGEPAATHRRLLAFLTAFQLSNRSPSLRLARHGL